MFESDAANQTLNLARHRLDLADVQLLFDGRPVMSTPFPRDGEMRFVTTGRIGERFYSAVWTERGAAIRLIPFRRARDGEERAYQARLGRGD